MPIEYNNIVSKKICDEIIKLFNEIEHETFEMNLYKYKYYSIPKSHFKWIKYEFFLYKQLLLYLKKYDEYKCKMNQINENNSFILKNFNIISYSANNNNTIIDNFNKQLNRNNYFSFVYLLNTIDDAYMKITDDNDKTTEFKINKGSLIIYPENINYFYNFKLPFDCELFVITGQLRINNISCC